VEEIRSEEGDQVYTSPPPGLRVTALRIVLAPEHIVTSLPASTVIVGSTETFIIFADEQLSASVHSPDNKFALLGWL